MTPIVAIQTPASRRVSRDGYGGTTAAVFYGLIATCKARGIDPKIYVHDVMLRLAEGADPKLLTPREWHTRHAAEVTDRRGYVLAQLVAKLAR